MHADETPEQAMYRELNEEIGLSPAHVTVLGRTREWLYYDLPEDIRRRAAVNGDGFRGQKQIWFLLRLIGREQDVRLDTTLDPEFQEWRWIDYWRALDEIVEFKRDVYRLALIQLEPLLKA